MWSVWNYGITWYHLIVLNLRSLVPDTKKLNSVFSESKDIKLTCNQKKPGFHYLIYPFKINTYWVLSINRSIHYWILSTSTILPCRLLTRGQSSLFQGWLTIVCAVLLSVSMWMVFSVFWFLSAWHFSSVVIVSSILLQLLTFTPIPQISSLSVTTVPP